MTIVQEYIDLTIKWKREYGEKTLVLMQVGSFFEAYGFINENGEIYGSNIVEFANICDMHISKKNVCVGNKKVVMAGFGLPQLEKYVKKLQENGYIVIVYTQDTQAKNTSRSLNTIFSPGTFFSNDNTVLSNNLMCIWLSKYINLSKQDYLSIGISNIDIFTGKVSIFEYSNIFFHNPTTYDELERYLSIYNPKEIIIISNLEDNYINDIINFTNINSIKIIKINLNDSTNLVINCKNAEKQIYQEEILNKFYKNYNIEILFNNLKEYSIAVQALIFLLDYVYSHNPNLVDKLSEPIFENYSNRLVLANHSLKQLNIIPDERYKGKYSSVLNLLNNCLTSMGKRELNHTLLNPITCVKELNKSYEITSYLLKESKIWQEIRKNIVEIKDLEKIRRKMILQRISPKEYIILFKNFEIILTIYKLVNKDKYFKNYLSDYFDLKLIYDNLIFHKKEILNFFDFKKSEYIDDFSPVNGFEKFLNYDTKNLLFINKGVSNELDEEYKKSIESKQKLEAIKKYFSNLLNNFEKNTKINAGEFVKIHETAKSDPILMITKRRSVILKKEIEKIMDKNTEGIIKISFKSDFSEIDEEFNLNINNIEFINNSINNNILITSIELKEIYMNINSCKINLIKKLEINYHKFLYKNTEYNFLDIINFIIKLDMLQCKCYIADEFNYCKPIITENDKSFIKFEGIRHSLIEQINQKELYITNDLSLGKENINGILLYGTNAVGKTSFIKSVGISIILAQGGFYVPASYFEYYPYKSIFTRILGSDNLFKGLSTFAVEMSELRQILQLSNKYSLILGDELCSGTESDSALSIFVTGLENLHKNRSTFLFATHFHEIVKYEEVKNLENLKMMHMEVKFCNETQELIYDRKLKEGAGDSMYGLEVCKSLSLPIDFLDRAHELRIKYNNIYKNLLSENLSKYSRNKLKGICEICKLNMGSEIHHLNYQKDAVNKYIVNKDVNFNKDNAANLINICESCHQKIHKDKLILKKHKINGRYEVL